MKIIKYKKIKNKYRIYFDNNETLDLYERVITSNNLLLKTDISSDLIEKIKKENLKEDEYEKVLKYISIKMRSKKEIEKYINKNNFESNKEYIVKRLESNGLIDDEKYIKSYIQDRFNLSSDGPNKISFNLINLGFDEDIVYKNIYLLDRQEIINKLDKLIDKKIKITKNYSGNVLKIKLISYFINLGYDKELIEEIISKKNINNDNGEKEYYKLLNKYSKKYSGYELERVIRQKLYQKGYNLDEIKENI